MKNALATHVRCNHARLLDLAIAAILAALPLAPTLRAQPAGQPTPSAKEKPADARIERISNGGIFYSMKFDGGPMHRLKQVWKDAFTNDNFVMTKVNSTATTSLIVKALALPNDQLVNTLFLNVLSRYPTAAEMSTALQNLQTQATRTQEARYLYWSLYNKVDFVFNY